MIKEEVDEECAVVLLPPASFIDVKQPRRRAFIPYRDCVNGVSGELGPFTSSSSRLSVNTQAELTLSPPIHKVQLSFQSWQEKQSR